MTDMQQSTRQPSWRDSLQPGSLVLVSDGGYGTTRRETVVKLTATQIVLSRDQRFRRVDGYAVSRDGWRRAALVEPTQATLDKLRKQELIAELARMGGGDWDKLPLATLEEISAIVQNHMPTESAKS